MYYIHQEHLSSKEGKSTLIHSPFTQHLFAKGYHLGILYLDSIIYTPLYVYHSLYNRNEYMIVSVNDGSIGLIVVSPVCIDPS